MDGIEKIIKLDYKPVSAQQEELRQAIRNTAFIHKELLNNGFTEDQAMQIVCAMVSPKRGA